MHMMKLSVLIECLIQIPIRTIRAGQNLTQTIISFGLNKTYDKVQHVEASAGYHDGRVDHWKQKKVMGGGAMYAMGVYPLNAARYTTGEEPLAVSAQASTDRPKIYHEVQEHINFELRFPSGATATCVGSFGRGLNSHLVTCANRVLPKLQRGRRHIVAITQMLHC